ncbi:MAG: low molecular weight protein-tyrosine-phosphatase [Rhodoferax sp.]
MSKPEFSLLFVCMGNICRSPTAHAVMQARVDAAGLTQRVRVDSAGTHAYHVGEPPDARAQVHARQRGYDLSRLRARAVTAGDYARFDLVLAMDWDNLALLQADCPPAYEPRLRRLTEFCLQFDSPVVPDPYYGGDAGFEHVLDLIEDASLGLLRHVERQLERAR